MTIRSRWHAACQPAAFLGTALVALVPLMACGGEPPQRNIVLVTFDTTRADQFSSYGNQAIKTPRVDALAGDGVLFRRAFSAVPVTAPSHSTIITGQYPPAHGVRDNGLFVLTPGQTTLAEILKDQGYATAAAVGAFPLDSQFGLDQGFDLYDDQFTASYEDFRGNRIRAKSGLFFDERKAALVNEPIFQWLDERQLDARQGTGGSEQPFFIWLHYFDPHHPHEPPSPYDELYGTDLYKGEIAYADESLGAVIDKLQALGVWDDTIMVMTADHGEGLGEHNEETHSTLAYNATIHVPLVMRVPGGPRGRAIDARVGTVDIVPTILDFLGIEAPVTVQGRSLRAMIEEETDPSENAPSAATDGTLYAETLAPRFSHGLGEIRALFHRQYKYIFGPRPELYDVDADPHELANLIDREPAVTEAMHARLADFLAEHAAQDPASLLEVDAETRARLEALGYIQSSGGDATVVEKLDGSGTPPQDRVTDVNDISTAKNFLHRNKPVAAKEVALKLLRRDPDNVYYLQLKASAELQSNQLELGLETMARIRELDPRGLPAEGLLLQVVHTLYYQGRGDEAIMLLSDAQKGKPSALGQWHLASLHSLAGRRADEITALEKALELVPTFAPARVDLAAYHAMSGDLPTAQREFERALRDLPYYPKAHYNYAALKMQMGDPETAFHHFERAAKLQPDYVRAYYALVVTALELDQRAAAEDHFATLLELAPDSNEAKQAQDLLRDSPETSS